MTATSTDPEKILLAGPGRAPNPTPDTIASVARAHGTSPLKQFREILGQRFAAGKMTAQEYYANRLYRSDLNREDKKRFIGERGSKSLNDRLSPKRLTNKRPFVRDKLIYCAMMQQLGFPMTETQAIVSHHRALGDTPVLRSAEEIEEFLRTTARYPLFAKPEEGSGSIGSALIERFDAASGMLRFGNGKEIDVAAFAREAHQEYGHGLILQTAVAQHPEVGRIIGDAVGCLRIVTVIEDKEPRVLYALWKMPSPTAMSDNYWQDGSIIAALDIETGTIERVQRGTGEATEELENHPVSGARLRGWQVPDWERMCDVALRGHHVLPEFGVFGWDIAMGADGPVIIECNANPHHMLYQLATGEPVLNDDFVPVFDRIAARGQKMLAEVRANRKAFEKRRTG